MEADGSDATRLVDMGNRAYPPCWSPDSRRLAFMHSLEIYVIDVDERSLSQLTSTQWRMEAPPPHRPWSVEPTWSLDGERIAFASLRGASPVQQIYVVKVDGSDLIQLTVRGGGHPAWSPDGERIAFLASR